ncbi:MAG: aminoacyl-tRNA hydrolase [Proteobacteria bacterium]|nr:aminoacyl-tRNA hydrolase [Pseudomonadota bacterium]
MYCIAGLGNPGEEYKETRHNLGFQVVDTFAERLSASIRRQRYEALTVSAKSGRTEVLIMKPQTFMNLCGRSIGAACHDLGIAEENVVVVYDDADLPLGRLRLRQGGGSGGHRGVESVIGELGTTDFGRVKVGVGKSEDSELSDYLLSDFDESEKALVKKIAGVAADALSVALGAGFVTAMNRFNSVDLGVKGNDTGD